MEIRTLTPRYSVSPQIALEDIPAIKAAGFTTLICNRPDAEITPDIHAQKMEAAATAAGLSFTYLPLTHATMTPENIARQNALFEKSEGPTLAYCASGTRCSVIWSLSQAKVQSVDDILATTAKAGYALDQLRAQLELIANS